MFSFKWWWLFAWNGKGTTIFLSLNLVYFFFFKYVSGTLQITLARLTILMENVYKKQFAINRENLRTLLYEKYVISSFRSLYVNDVMLLPVPKFSHSSKVAFETDPSGTFRWVSKNSEVVNLISRPHRAELIFASNFCRHSLFVWKSTVMGSYSQWEHFLEIFLEKKKPRHIFHSLI